MRENVGLLVSKSESKLSTVETKQEMGFAVMFGEPVVMIYEVEGKIVMDKPKPIPKATKKEK